MTSMNKDNAQATKTAMEMPGTSVRTKITPEEARRLHRYLSEWRNLTSELHPLLHSRLPFAALTGLLQAGLLSYVMETLHPGSFELSFTSAASVYLLTLGTVMFLRVRKLKRQLTALKEKVPEPVAFKGETVQSRVAPLSEPVAHGRINQRALGEAALHMMDTRNATKH